MRPESKPAPTGREPGIEPGMMCRDVQELLHAHVDGELEGFRAVLVDRHLLGCAPCRKVRNDLERERIWIIEAALDAPRVPASFASRVVDRVRESRRATKIRWWRDAFFRASGAAAAIAIVSVAALRIPSGTDPGAGGPEGSGIVLDERTDDSSWPPVSRAVVAPIPVEVVFVAHAPSDSAHDGHPAARAAEVRLVSDLVFAAYDLGQPGKKAVRSFDRGVLCRPDPNSDGRSDLNDVAYSLQLMMPDRSVEPVIEEESSGDPECVDICLKV